MRTSTPYGCACRTAAGSATALRSIVSLAPYPRIRSALSARTFAITFPPAFAANCVAKEPTPPPAPTIRTVLSSSGSSWSTRASPGAARRRQCGRDNVIESSWNSCERRVLANGHVLGVGTRRAKRGDQQLAEQIVADGVPRRTFAKLFDHPRPVGAEHHRERRGHRLPRAGGEPKVHWVHARGPQPDQDLPRSRLRRWDLHRRWSASVFPDRDRAHRVLLTFVGWIIPRQHR